MTIIHSILSKLRNKLNIQQPKGMVISIEEIPTTTKRIFASEQQVVHTPEISQMQFLEKAKHLQNSEYHIPEIYTTVLENVLYCPKYNIIMSETRKIINESINTALDGDIDYNFLLHAEIKTLPGWNAVFRSIHNNFYHAMIDNIPRTSLLAKDENYLNNDVQLVSSSPLKGIETFFLEKIFKDKPNVKVLNTKYLYKVEKLIFPSFLTQRFAGFLPSVYLQDILPKVLPKREPKRNKRIYISRVKSAWRKVRSIENEDALFEIIKLLGFEKYVLENLNLTEQIELFYNAEIVMGPHGAGFTNLLFAGPIHVIELFPTQQVVPHYYFLSKSLNQHYHHWCGSESSKNSNFKVNIDEIKKILEQII